ncbi:MAG TPA: alkaline phosphatase family protein, partial [Luteitalea sp.]|nr:alkaline phosphatase family protein [Luteitalea sp.]
MSTALRRPRRLALLLCACLALVVEGRTRVAAQAEARAPGASQGVPPSLVVVLVVDQFRADYVERYGHQWRQGLRRIFDGGAHFTEAAYPYASTMTCAGHATIGTGTLPQTHGLIANAWYDRATARDVVCTEDRTVTNVGYGPNPPRYGDSSARLAAPTLGDEMRAQLGAAPRIVTMALKARAAMPLAGQRSTLTTWFDGARGFVTSPAMGTPGRDPFLAKYLAEHPVEADTGAVWARRLPAETYLFTDEGDGEIGMGRRFPHPLSRASGEGQVDAAFYGNWQMSPFADDYLGHLAQAAVGAFGLGQGARTDYLAVSFSALDVIGHAYGPRSHEVQDTLVRLDDTIGVLLDLLDKQVGRDHYVLALTGDHGAGPVPEQMRALGLRAGVIDRKALASAITAVVGGSLIDSISGGELYLS